MAIRYVAVIPLKQSSLTFQVPYTSRDVYLTQFSIILNLEICWKYIENRFKDLSIKNPINVALCKLVRAM